jgi:hypothetical protein
MAKKLRQGELDLSVTPAGAMPAGMPRSAAAILRRKIPGLRVSPLRHFLETFLVVLDTPHL